MTNVNAALVAVGVDLVEAPEVTGEHDYEHLHTIREHFRVEGAAEQPRLVSKNA
jgi:hypothetical protein